MKNKRMSPSIFYTHPQWAYLPFHIPLAASLSVFIFGSRLVVTISHTSRRYWALNGSFDIFGCLCIVTS